MPKAVFFDRDDTLMEARSLPPPPSPAAPGDVVDPALVRLMPGAKEACERIRKAGFLLVVVSNQGVVARGGGTIETVHQVNRRLAELLGPIDASYFCPFHPKGTVAEFAREHEWRKPGPGMVRCAAAELGIDLGRSWLVGDMPRDVEAGIGAGIEETRCLLLGHDVADLKAAADRICG